MCFSSVCCLRWLNFLTRWRCLQCRLSSKSISCKERHIMVGTVPSICTVVAAGEFCGIFWADWLFCSLLTIVSLLGCLLWLRIVHRHRGHKNRCSSVLQSQKSSCSTVVDFCQSWISAAAVLAIHHRGLWCEAAPFLFFFFFSVWRSPCLLFFFLVYFSCSFWVEVWYQCFSSPSQLVLAVVTCYMGGAVVLLGSAAVKLTQ